MPKIETISINDLVTMFRDFGIKTSADVLGRGIAQEKFPFAIAVEGQNAVGKPCYKYMIFKKDAESWLLAKAE